MEMSRAGTGAGNADMQHAALQPDSEIASDNANQNFDQCDRNSGPDRDQAGNEREAHPDSGYKPNIFKHYTPSAWKESLAHAVSPTLTLGRQTPLPWSESTPLSCHFNYKLSSVRSRRSTCGERNLHFDTFAEIKLTADRLVDEKIFFAFAFHTTIVT